MDEALRSFLESFRLPGESPVIEHIIEFFAELFYVSGQSSFMHYLAICPRPLIKPNCVLSINNVSNYMLAHLQYKYKSIHCLQY